MLNAFPASRGSYVLSTEGTPMIPALPDRSYSLDRDSARSSRKGETLYPRTDFVLMLEAWHAGGASRDVALEMADRDREASRPMQIVGLVAA